MPNPGAMTGSYGPGSYTNWNTASLVLSMTQNRKDSSFSRWTWDGHSRIYLVLSGWCHSCTRDWQDHRREARTGGCWQDLEGSNQLPAGIFQLVDHPIHRSSVLVAKNPLCHPIAPESSSEGYARPNPDHDIWWLIMLSNTGWGFNWCQWSCGLYYCSRKTRTGQVF